MKDPGSKLPDSRKAPPVDGWLERTIRCLAFLGFVGVVAVALLLLLTASDIL